MSIRIIFISNNFLIEKINHIFHNLADPRAKYSFCLNLLSLGGLPPFLGFAAKLSVIQAIIHLNNQPIVLLLVIISLISLYYYLRLTYSFLIETKLPKGIASPPGTPLSAQLMLWGTVTMAISPALRLI